MALVACDTYVVEDAELADCVGDSRTVGFPAASIAVVRGSKARESDEQDSENADDVDEGLHDGEVGLCSRELVVARSEHTCRFIERYNRPWSLLMAWHNAKDKGIVGVNSELAVKEQCLQDLANTWISM